MSLASIARTALASALLAALAAVAKWKYQPHLKDGKPIEAQSETVIRFQMEKGKG